MNVNSFHKQTARVNVHINNINNPESLPNSALLKYLNNRENCAFLLGYNKYFTDQKCHDSVCFITMNEY